MRPCWPSACTTAGRWKIIWTPGTRLQQLILKTIAEVTEVPADQITVAIDGCGAPVFYVPLGCIAMAYAKFAAAARGTLPAGPLTQAMATLTQACLAHPRLIAGTAVCAPISCRPSPAGYWPRPGPKAAMPWLSLMPGWAWLLRSLTATPGTQPHYHRNFGPIKPSHSGRGGGPEVLSPAGHQKSPQRNCRTGAAGFYLKENGFEIQLKIAMILRL